MYLRLEAVKSQLDELPIGTPEYFEDDPPAEPEQTVVEVLAEELKQLVRIRSVGAGESLKPLLAPEEER